MQYGLRFCPSLRRLGETCRLFARTALREAVVIERGLAPGDPGQGRDGHVPRRAAGAAHGTSAPPKSMSGRFARRFHGVPARSAHTGRLAVKRRGGAAIRGVVRSFPVRAHFAAPPGSPDFTRQAWQTKNSPSKWPGRSMNAWQRSSTKCSRNLAGGAA